MKIEEFCEGENNGPKREDLRLKLQVGIMIMSNEKHEEEIIVHNDNCCARRQKVYLNY